MLAYGMLQAARANMEHRYTGKCIVSVAELHNATTTCTVTVTLLGAQSAHMPSLCINTTPSQVGQTAEQITQTTTLFPTRLAAYTSLAYSRTDQLSQCCARWHTARNMQVYFPHCPSGKPYGIRHRSPAQVPFTYKYTLHLDTTKYLVLTQHSIESFSSKNYIKKIEIYFISINERKTTGTQL